MLRRIFQRIMSGGPKRTAAKSQAGKRSISTGRLFRQAPGKFARSSRQAGADAGARSLRRKNRDIYSRKVAQVQHGASLPFSGVRIFYFFLFAMLFLAMYLGYLLVLPFFHTIVLACIFAALSHPLYSLVLKRVRQPWLASGVTLIMLVVVVCLPVAFFVISMIPQAARISADFSQWLVSNRLEVFINDQVYPVLHWLQTELSWMDMDVANIREDLLTYSREIGSFLVTTGTGFVVNTFTLVVNFFLMLLIMFFLLKDGEGMVNVIKHLTPLRADQEDSIIHNLRRMARAVLVGGFMVAALQGLVGGIGLAIVGLPAMFWGVVMAFAALVPVFGTALVWAPMCLYLFLTGNEGQALFLLVWCGALVTSVDSFLRPVIIRGNSKTSLLLLFLAVLGGIKAFGVLGIVYGPLILSFLGVMLGIYSEEYQESLTSYHGETSRKARKFSTATGFEESSRRKFAPARRSALRALAAKGGGPESPPENLTEREIIAASFLAAHAHEQPPGQADETPGEKKPEEEKSSVIRAIAHSDVVRAFTKRYDIFSE
jgi:predicted PurR-regulated permease PerM